MYKVYFMEQGVKRYVQSGMTTEFDEKRARRIVDAMAAWKRSRKCFLERVEAE